MVCFFDKRDRIVAIFTHWSDSLIYENQNARHQYRKEDLPDLETVIARAIGQPIGPDAQQTRLSGRGQDPSH